MRAYSPSFPRFWCGKIDQSQVLWSVASCDANDKIESLLQKVELRSTLRNILPQLATSKFVAWQVESEGGNTGNNAFQLATQQCCATSCAKMLPVLLDLYTWRDDLTENESPLPVGVRRSKTPLFKFSNDAGSRASNAISLIVLGKSRTRSRPRLRVY